MRAVFPGRSIRKSPNFSFFLLVDRELSSSICEDFSVRSEKKLLPVGFRDS